MAQTTFFFYDLETSGVNPRTDRVMQFAGQRTTLQLEPIGEPVNVLIKLAPDVVPSPDAILITGITPQATLNDGVTEAEFLELFCEQVVVPNTIFTGFNTVRFDDEFMRYMLYRNFYDPYEWQWKDGRSRWDLLDVARMARALRPEGIKWPVDDDGKPTNRLELLTAANKLNHVGAHDALADVRATIAFAQLLRTHQPKLFEYLLSIRDKNSVKKIVMGNEPFLYSSGKYASEHEKTTVVATITQHPTKQCAYVYDLRHDPTQYKDYSIEQLVEAWRWKKDAPEQRLPIKALRFNCCPAVAPLSVLDESAQKRTHITLADIRKHHRALQAMPDFADKILKAVQQLDTEQQTRLLENPTTVDGQLYDGFFDDHDRELECTFRRSSPEEFQELSQQFHDQRLQTLAPLYKARNYPEALTEEESRAWEKHLHTSLLGGGAASSLAKFFARLEQLAALPQAAEKQHILEELQLYGQSIMPVYDADESEVQDMQL